MILHFSEEIGYLTGMLRLWRWLYLCKKEFIGFCTRSSSVAATIAKGRIIGYAELADSQQDVGYDVKLTPDLNNYRPGLITISLNRRQFPYTIKFMSIIYIYVRKMAFISLKIS